MKCLSYKKNRFFYFKPFLVINEDWINQKKDNARDTTLGYIEKILQHLLEDSYYRFFSQKPFGVLEPFLKNVDF